MVGEPHARQLELAAIERAFDRAVAGQCTVVVVEGEPGIGKTHLLAAATARAEARGAFVLRSGITEVEAMLSWAGVSVLLSRIDESVLADLAPAQRHALARARGEVADGAVDAPVMAAACAEAIARGARGRPVVLVVDDLQWLDRASAAALTFAIRSNSRASLAVVAAQRRGAAVPVDFGRIEGVTVERVVLGPMSVAGIYKVLTDAGLPSPRRPDLLRIIELSGGNPLHALEVARALLEGRTLAQVPASELLPAESWFNIRALTEQALEAARICALMARPTISVVRRAIGPGADRALVELEQRGVIRSEADRIDFTHPLRREFVLSGMGGAERRLAHLRIADAIDDPSQVVLHRAEAAEAPEADLADALERVADATVAFGVHDLAAARYRRAAELTPAPAPRDRWRRTHLAVRSSVAVGDHAIVADEARRLLEDADSPSETTVAALDLLDVVLRCEGVTPAVEVAERALAHVPDLPEHRTTLLERLMRLQQLRGDFAAAARTARAALAEARSSGDEDAVRRAEVMSACADVLVGEPVDVVTLREPAVVPAHSGVDASTFLFEVLVWTDHLDRVEPAIRAAEERARANGGNVELVRLLTQRGDLYLRSSRWDEAEQCLIEAYDLGKLIGYTVGADADLAWLAAARGDDARALALLAEEEGRLPPPTSSERVQHLARAGFVELCAGRAAAAAEILLQARREANDIGMVDVPALPFGQDLVEALALAGALDTAAREADAFAAAAARARSPLGVALGLRCQAIVAAAARDGDRAAALAQQAVAAHGHAPSASFEAARTGLVAGSALRRVGRRVDARGHLWQARDTFSTLGAVPFVARADEELARLGTRRATVGLTSTEQQVAELATAGLTNAEIAARLFVSVRTVESNLTRVYRKLQVRSRTELARRLLPPG